MPKPYSVDLRARVIEEVETGASRREAAERYGISPSVVVIWVQRFEETGSVAAKPSGGSISPLEQHAEFLLGLIAHQRADVSRLCEAMPCPDPQARRDRADGPCAGPQDRRRCGGDRSSGRGVGLSSEVFAGPQPDRAGLQQTQGASAQGGRAYDSAAPASDRSRRYRFQPARMQELLSPCRLCSNMTGIRSKPEEGRP